MPTKELLVDIGNYLEGNYNMGSAAAQVVDETTKAINTGSGGRTGQTNLKPQGRYFDKQIADKTSLDENLRSAGTQTHDFIMKGPGEKNALSETTKLVQHWLDETSNILSGDTRGKNRAARNKKKYDQQIQDLQDKLNASSQSYGQDKGKKKKKKGLLAMNTPSAKASRFRSGKRRFRVKPGSGTGVNVAGSGGSTVGTS